VVRLAADGHRPTGRDGRSAGRSQTVADCRLASVDTAFLAGAVFSFLSLLTIFSSSYLF
jgi:hypothetical protein